MDIRKVTHVTCIHTYRVGTSELLFGLSFHLFSFLGAREQRIFWSDGADAKTRLSDMR